VLPPFPRFLEETRTPVWRLLCVLCLPDDVEDCFQETYVAALRAFPKLQDARNLRAWVLTIAERKAMDSHRSRRKRPRPAAELPDVALCEKDGFDPALWAAVRALPPKQRTAVAQRYVADLTYREISRVMGTSEEAARQNVREGLRKLREVLR